MQDDTTTKLNNDSPISTGETRRKEHMLITLWGSEPRVQTDMIRSRFPHIEITYCEVSAVNNFVDVLGVSDQVPDELWNKATILVTLFALPRSRCVAPNLRYIHLLSAGIDHFLDPSKPHPLILDILHLPSSSSPDQSTTNPTPSPSLPPITITTSTGISAPPIAEWILMTLLALTNRFSLTQTWQRQHHWGDKPTFLSRQGDWSQSKTIGILGYGSIGRHLARILTAMNTNVHAYTLNARTTPSQKRDKSYRVPGTGDPEGEFPTQWFHHTQSPSNPKQGLHDFLSSGLHALVVCLPLTNETRGLIGMQEFRILRDSSPYPPSTSKEQPEKQGGYVVNISRGSIINQTDLVNALKQGIIRGAALDVTDPEPLPVNSELWDMWENVIITPHVSALGEEYTARAFDVLIENLGWMSEDDGDGEEGKGKGVGMRMWNVVQKGKGY